MDEVKLFLPFGKTEKKDDGSVVVHGYASTPAKDSDGEIVTLKAVKSALPGYMAWGNIREMHRLSAVGTARDAVVDDTGLLLTARIVDKEAVKKVVEGVYKGFSIGGRKLAKAGDQITEIEMSEISIVDRPANTECRFALAKSAKEMLPTTGGYLVKAKALKSPEQRALAKMASAVEILAKNGNPPAAKDGFSLPAEVKKGEACTEHGVVDCDKCAMAKRDFDTAQREAAAKDGSAMPGGRFPIKNEEDLKNAIKLRGQASDKKAVKAHIMARAKAIGKSDLLPPKWSQKAAAKEAKKAHKAHELAKSQAQITNLFDLNKSAGPSFLTLSAAGTDHTEGVEPGHDGIGAGLLAKSLEGRHEIKEELPAFLDLTKSMSSATTLSCVFDQIRSAQRSLLMEAKREGGDMKDKQLAKTLGEIAKQLAGVIGQKAEHEGSEALDLSDADDTYCLTSLGEDFTMAENQNDLTKVLQEILAKAGTRPMSKAARMNMAMDNMKKAKKARKAASGAIQDAHAMHKAAYLSKAAGKKAEEEFDHQAAMEKLQKAYGELEKVSTFEKAAREQMKKAMAGRSGESGQEANDPDSPFYEVPAGVKTLSPSDLATAGPGGGKGSEPIVMTGDGSVVTGKTAITGNLAKFVKNGQVPVEVVELIAQNMQLSGANEAFRNLPAGRTERRPFAFDLTKVIGSDGNARSATDIAKDREALFKNVNSNAIGSGDERAHNEAAAGAIGNYILNANRFGKSVFDPGFHGTAGATS